MRVSKNDFAHRAASIGGVSDRNSPATIRGGGTGLPCTNENKKQKKLPTLSKEPRFRRDLIAGFRLVKKSDPNSPGTVGYGLSKLSWPATLLRTKFKDNFIFAFKKCASHQSASAAGDFAWRAQCSPDPKHLPATCMSQKEQATCARTGRPRVRSQSVLLSQNVDIFFAKRLIFFFNPEWGVRSPLVLKSFVRHRVHDAYPTKKSPPES